jgi:hypothetical protein
MYEPIYWAFIFAMAGLYLILAISIWAMRRKEAALKRREYQLILNERYVDKRAEELDRKLFNGLC